MKTDDKFTIDTMALALCHHLGSMDQSRSRRIAAHLIASYRIAVELLHQIRTAAERRRGDLQEARLRDDSGLRRPGRALPGRPWARVLPGSRRAVCRPVRLDLCGATCTVLQS